MDFLSGLGLMRIVLFGSFRSILLLFARVLFSEGLMNQKELFRVLFFEQR